jgi:lipid-A-disaccharide synthase
LYFDKTPELMKSATVCLACSGSVSLELLYHRKPTVIVYKTNRWVMLLQSLLMRVRYITLVNLIAAQDISKNTWRPYDPDRPGAETAIMPEYLTCGNPSEKVAAHAIRWLTNAPARQAVVNRLDELARAYAHPGASAKAADYIIAVLRAKGIDTVVAAETANPRLNQRIPA